MDSATLQAVLDQLWPELPALAGDAWGQLEPKLAGYRRQLSSGDGDAAIVQAHILQTLVAYPTIYRRLLDLTAHYNTSGTKGVVRNVQPLESTTKQVTTEAVTNGAAAITRYTDIACPRRVWVETPRISVVVRLTVEQPEHSAATETLSQLSEAPVQVQLVAPGFDLLNAAKQETPILLDRDSPPLVFDLKPRRTDHTQLQFDFFQNGQPLRTVTVPIQITAHEVADEEAVQAHQAVTTPGNVAPPDLVLHVGWDAEHQRLEFTLIRDGGAWWRSFHPVSLDGSPATHAIELYRRITSLVNTEDPTAQVQLKQRLVIAADDVDRQIKQLGYHLWRTLLPADLRELYANERERWHDHSLLIYSDEPHLPWELIWPYDDVNGAWKDDAPWCVTMRLTRWLRRDAQGNGNEAAPSTLSLRAAAILAPHYQRLSKLALAPLERDTLKALFASRHIMDVSPASASWGEVMNLLEGGNYDWLHMASHGSFYAQAPTSDSAIWLDGDKALTPEQLGGPEMAQHFRQKRPAFVFNACEVGRQGWALTRIGGWANQLVSLNAGLFIGPLWIVSDSGAATFSGVLYGALLDGETVGTAVQKARRAARASGDPTWLAYSIYAHPNARLTTK
jgi:hypothetical protein